jgi:hypothetical protein
MKHENLSLNLFNPFKKLKTAIHLTAFFFLASALLFYSGCVFDDSDGTFSGGNGAEALHEVKGAIKSPVNRLPLSGINCVLMPYSGGGSFAESVYKTAVTGSDGSYSFSGVAPGRYKMISSAEGYIPAATIFTVDSNERHSITQLSEKEWPLYFGPGRPFDPARAYIFVITDVFPHLAGPEDSSVEVSLIKTGAVPVSPAYEARGHQAAAGAIDWNSSATYDSGVTVFYGVTPGQDHSISAGKPGHEFASASGVSAAPGVITTQILAGNPTVDGFPVAIENGTKVYKAENIYLAVTGKDNAGGFYYFDINKKDMVNINDPGAASNFCFSLSSIATVENGVTKYKYVQPFKYMISGKSYIFLGKPGNIGVDSKTKSLKEPSADNDTLDKYTIFDKYELTCDGKVTLNTTVVDFLGIAFKLRFNCDGADRGFEVTNNKEVADEFLKRSDNWKKCVITDLKGNIMRVVAPYSLTEFDNYLAKSIDNAWAHYSTNELNVTYDWNYRGKVQTDGSFKIDIRKSGSETIIETRVIPYKPGSKMIFSCDGEPMPNTKTPAVNKLHAFICAALNRGVFGQADMSGEFYKTSAINAGQFNVYAHILHEKAIDKRVYGFAYDDFYGKDTTGTKSYDEAKKGVVITLPVMPAVK